MNIFDLIILIPIALGLIFGLFKGFVKEVVSLSAVVLAIFAAEMFSKKIAPMLSSLLHLSEKMGHTAAYITVFVCTVIVALLFSNVAHKLLNNISLGWLNSILGGIFGALKIAIVVSVLMNVFDALDSKFSFTKPEKKEASMGYYPILKLAPSLWKNGKEIYETNKVNHPDNEASQPDGAPTHHE